MRGLPGAWLVKFAFRCAVEDPGDLGEQIGPPADELAEFADRDVLLVLGVSLPKALGSRTRLRVYLNVFIEGTDRVRERNFLRVEVNMLGLLCITADGHVLRSG